MKDEPSATWKRGICPQLESKCSVVSLSLVIIQTLLHLAAHKCLTLSRTLLNLLSIEAQKSYKFEVAFTGFRMSCFESRRSRQSSPIGCCWTATPCEQQIMTEDPQTWRKSTNLPPILALSLSLSPPRLWSQPDRCWKKMKLRKTVGWKGLRYEVCIET